MSAVVRDARNEGGRSFVTDSIDDQDLDLGRALHERAAQVVPAPGECASSFVARLLARVTPVRPPDFASRLRAKASDPQRAGQALRILSLGSGASAAERVLLERCETPVELILTGDDEDELSAALARFNPRHRVSYRVLDLESGLARWTDRFDVVFAHGALSRLTRLEPLLHDIGKLLRPSGELWVSREYVARAGGQMDERDAWAAEALSHRFQKLLKQGMDGAMNFLSEPDACLAGTRHGDRLVAWLRKHFMPVEECAHNVLLWRVLPPSVAVNLDLSRADHVALLRLAVVEDVTRAQSGGRPAMLDGIYQRAAAGAN